MGDGKFGRRFLGLKKRCSSREPSNRERRLFFGRKGGISGFLAGKIHTEKYYFSEALERSEDWRERRNSGDFWGDCLEEKHGGKDWQHASSSHWKPSNSSQRLVLPDDKFRDSWNERL